MRWDLLIDAATLVWRGPYSDLEKEFHAASGQQLPSAADLYHTGDTWKIALYADARLCVLHRDGHRNVELRTFPSLNGERPVTNVNRALERLQQMTPGEVIMRTLLSLKD